MSTLACSRKGCKNILCGRYSNTYGYICSDCFTELKQEQLLFSSDFSISNFMNTEKVVDELLINLDEEFIQS